MINLCAAKYGALLKVGATSGVSALKEAGYLSTVSDKWSQFPKSSGIIKNGKREDVSAPQKQWDT